jgi:Tfp pilus assembly protein PilW
MLKPRTSRRRLRMAGLSVVELMVGIAIGLIVVAAATLLMGSQLSENRRMLLEVQLQQDLRATGDIIAREIRRHGAMAEDRLLLSLWTPGATAAATANPFTTQIDTPDTGKLYLAYETDENPSNYHSVPGFELRSDGVIYSRVGVSTVNSWQPLTDPSTMNVTAFDVTEATTSEVMLPCPNVCPDSTTDCWPRVRVREVSFEIRAEARRDTTVKRSIAGTSRIRNEEIRQSCPA